MSEPFTLTVPAAAPYHSLVPDVAKKYAELSGAGPADGESLAAAVRDALGRVADGASSGTPIVLEFRQSPSGVEVTVRCGGRTASVAHPLPTRSKH